MQHRHHHVEDVDPLRAPAIAVEHRPACGLSSCPRRTRKSLQTSRPMIAVGPSVIRASQISISVAKPSFPGAPYCAMHWRMAFQPQRPRGGAPVIVAPTSSRCVSESIGCCAPPFFEACMAKVVRRTAGVAARGIAELASELCNALLAGHQTMSLKL
jgi:hypothetical protein